MRFTIDADKNSASEAYRLQEGEIIWRKLDGELGVQQGDLVVDSFRPLNRLCRTEQYLDIGEFCYLGNPCIRELAGNDYFHVLPRIHRTERPHLVTLDEVRSVLRVGDEEVDHWITLDIHGRAKLLSFDRSQARDDFRTAVYCEDLPAPCGYVGAEASRDDAWVSECYRSLLTGWVEHLRTGRCNRYVEFEDARAEEELLLEVNKLIAPL